MKSVRQAGGYLPSLTPLRGLAALWVGLYHCADQIFPSVHAIEWSDLLHKGYLAVDLFFLLSGFVLTHVYHEACGGRVGGNAGEFFKARVARLYPLHLVMLFVFVAATLGSRTVSYLTTGTFETIPLAGPYSWHALFASLFMLQGLQASTLSWNFPSWSISTEFAAYLLFPLALPLIWQARPLLRVLVTLAILGAIAWMCWLTGADFNQWDGPLAFLRCIPEFLLGALLYVVYRKRAAVRVLASDAAALGTAVLLLVLLHFNGPDPLIVVLFAALILTLVANTGRVGVVLNASILVWLGELSYAFYMVHGFVQHFTAETLVRAFGFSDHLMDVPIGEALLLAGAMLAATLLLAALAHRCVEVPGRRLVRRALSSPRPVQESVAA